MDGPVKFGVFEVDPRTGELRKAGIRLRLHDQPWKVLLVLIGRPGETITREELRQTLWPDDTFVDFDHSLNSAVAKLRDTLGDSAASPRYIETVPRKGYRFVAPVELLRPSPGQAAPEAPAAEPPRRRRTVLWLAIIALTIGAGTAVVRWSLQNRMPARPVPLTSYPGIEWLPAFSPDGGQVAFSWNGDLYVKLIDAERPLRLTTHAGSEKGPEWAPDASPAWSPDGRWIAFTKPLPNVADEPGWNEVVLVAPVGGPERNVTKIHVPFSCLRPLAWLPDGKNLVITDRLGNSGPHRLFVIATDGGDKRALTLSSEGGDDRDAAVSPDGRTVVFARGTGMRSALYRLALTPDARPAGEPVRINDAGALSGEPAWTPDGRSVIFAYGPQHRQLLHRIDVFSGGEPQPVTFLGDGAMHAAVSAARRRLVYTQYRKDQNIWELRADGKTAPSKLIASTYLDHVPQYSPDGQRVAFTSTRSGFQEIWLARRDGSDPVQLTSFNRGESVVPVWSPDGRHIAFQRHETREGSTWIIEADGGRPRELFEGGSGNWSRDGKWLYYSLHGNVWKRRFSTGAVSGDPVQVTRHGGSFAIESADGRHLYFSKPGSPPSLWRMPSGGGAEERVAESITTPISFAVTRDTIYWMRPSRATRGSIIEALEITTGKVRKLHETDKITLWGFSISPDGRSILYVQLDEWSSDLMLVENFR
ncbi:MAG: PD40 domain-containing protein, partial [Acidobacteria bacterium]|nr:PD40 domain-containing protein [Acidobacteriota bacterium]